MISIGTPAGVYLSALSSRLISTCSINTSSIAHQRELGRHPGGDAPPSQAGAEPAERGADDLLQRMPLAAQLQGPRLQPRHLEQVLHQPVQTLGLVAHGLQQLVAGAVVEAGAALQDRADGAGDRGQRRAQVVRHRAEQGVAQPFGLDPHLSGLRVLGQARALQRQRRLGGEGLELVQPLGRVHCVAVGRPQSQHADRSRRGQQRDVEGGGAGQGRRCRRRPAGGARRPSARRRGHWRRPRTGHRATMPGRRDPA